MEIRTQVIATTVDYFCDNCKSMPMRYLRDDIARKVKPEKVYSCSKCGFTKIFNIDYPRQEFIPDTRKVDQLTDLEIVKIRKFLVDQDEIENWMDKKIERNRALIKQSHLLEQEPYSAEELKPNFIKRRAKRRSE